MKRIIHLFEFAAIDFTLFMLINCIFNFGSTLDTAFILKIFCLICAAIAIWVIIESIDFHSLVLYYVTQYTIMYALLLSASIYQHWISLSPKSIGYFTIEYLIISIIITLYLNYRQKLTSERINQLLSQR